MAGFPSVCVHLICFALIFCGVLKGLRQGRILTRVFLAIFISVLVVFGLSRIL